MGLFRPDWRSCSAQRGYVCWAIGFTRSEDSFSERLSGMWQKRTMPPTGSEKSCPQCFSFKQPPSSWRSFYPFSRCLSILHVILVFSSPPSSTTKQNLPVCMPFFESPALNVCMRSAGHRVNVQNLLATIFIILFRPFHLSPSTQTPRTPSRCLLIVWMTKLCFGLDLVARGVGSVLMDFFFLP